MKNFITIGNLNCIFINESATVPFLHYWKRFVKNAFIENMSVKARGSEYVLKDVIIVHSQTNLSYISGRLYRKTVLSIDKKLDKSNNVILIGTEVDTAPSSIFTYILDNHTLLHTIENKGGPNELAIATYFRKSINIQRQKFLKELVRSKTQKPRFEQIIKSFPVLSVSYTAIPDKESIHDFLSKLVKIDYINLKRHSQNGVMKADALFTPTDQLLKELASPAAQVRISKPQNKENTKAFVEEASLVDRAYVKISGTDNQKNKIGIDNEGLAFKKEIRIDRNIMSKEALAPAQIAKYTEAINNEEIPILNATNNKKFLRRIEK